MPDFSRRSQDSELMDGPIERQEELFTNLKELEFINMLTGGPALGFSALKKMLAGATREVHIVDIGFGAGDMLQYIQGRASELPCPIRLTGVDLMPEAIAYTRQMHPHLKADLVCMDYQHWFEQGNTADVALAGLFCHHLSDQGVSDFAGYVKRHTRIGGIVNDLHRHPVAYYSIKWATQAFSRSRFTKNDAPLSVLRGFSRAELEGMMAKAGVQEYRLQWRWAFRYLLTIKGHA